MRRLFFLLCFMAFSAWAEGAVYRVGVNGLACPFCAFGIEKQLLKIDGVEQAETDIKQGYVVLSVEEGKIVNQDQAEQAVKKAGFSLRSFKQIEP